MTNTEPPSNMETKSTQPGYNLGEIPHSEQGLDGKGGLQPGYSNSPGLEGDDGEVLVGGAKSTAKSDAGKRGTGKSSDK